jgi:hypothetical protein
MHSPTAPFCIYDLVLPAPFPFVFVFAFGLRARHTVVIFLELAVPSVLKRRSHAMQASVVYLQVSLKTCFFTVPFSLAERNDTHRVRETRLLHSTSKVKGYTA